MLILVTHFEPNMLPNSSPRSRKQRITSGFTLELSIAVYKEFTKLRKELLNSLKIYFPYHQMVPTHGHLTQPLTIRQRNQVHFLGQFRRVGLNSNSTQQPYS
jgi:hypothetical protein